MNINKKSLVIGVLLLLTGLITVLVGYNPSRILQYIFIAASLSIGVFALLTGKEERRSFTRSKYYIFIGITSILMAISVGIWATTLSAFIDVIGFFLLSLGIIEFVFVLQILNSETPTPWKAVGLKLGITTVVATGAAWILTTAGFNVNLALLACGGLLVSVSISSFRRIGANHYLRQSLVFFNVPAMPQPEVYIASAQDLFDENGELINDSTKEFLESFLTAL